MIENGIIQVDNIYGVPFTVDLIPAANKTSRPALPMNPKGLTIHNTGNQDKNATAKMHTDYVDNAWDKYVSWAFTVDDNEIFQELPINENAWHAGDGYNGKGNRTQISIEICEYEGIDWKKARQNGIKLIVWLINNIENITADTIYTHQRWSGKYCPHRILDEGWDNFMEDVKKELDRQNSKAPQWKIDGEKWLRENGIINSKHDPLEIVDFGELGTILKNFYNKLNK